MALLNDYSTRDVRLLRARIQAELRGCDSLCDAAQQCADLLCREFTETLVLARLFVSLPFGALPPRDRAFVAALATAKGVLPELTPRTRVLSLAGTCGVQPEWCDRYRSAGHLGIPLVSSEFVESIPMIARLMSDMGLGAGWINDPGAAISTTSMEQIAGVFYVADAATWLDSRQRKIVPEQEFVSTHGIKTVFGLGGSYLDGNFVTMILFTRETMSQAQVEEFMPLIIAFKIVTMEMAATGSIFA